MTTSEEPPAGKTTQGPDCPTTRAPWTLPAQRFADETEAVVPVLRESEREQLTGPPAWIRLTTDEALLIFLALEEYASAFSLSLPADELERARGLARRVAKSAALHLDE